MCSWQVIVAAFSITRTTDLIRIAFEGGRNPREVHIVSSKDQFRDSCCYVIVRDIENVLVFFLVQQYTYIKCVMNRNWKFWKNFERKLKIRLVFLKFLPPFQFVRVSLSSLRSSKSSKYLEYPNVLSLNSRYQQTIM